MELVLYLEWQAPKMDSHVLHKQIRHGWNFLSA